MLASIFQLSGGILLAYMVTFRRKEDIAGLLKKINYNVVKSNGELVVPKPNILKRLIYETWISRVGL